MLSLDLDAVSHVTRNQKVTSDLAHVDLRHIIWKLVSVYALTTNGGMQIIRCADHAQQTVLNALRTSSVINVRMDSY